jgi:hypothetical protein
MKKFQKALFVLMLAIQFTAATSVAQADIEIPSCYPCDGK